LDSQGLKVDGEVDDLGADLGLMAPSADVDANVSRWDTGDGIAIEISDPFGSPDSGGSFFIGTGAYVYKVTVRPESGLTTRSLVAR
jgi:hypothetical protein